MDPVEDVVVELVDRDLTVSVEVRLSLLQAIDDGLGEDRSRAGSDDVVTFPRVLHRVRCREDDPAAPFEPFAHLDVAREPSMAHAPRERTAVAAVEEQHDPRDRLRLICMLTNSAGRAVADRLPVSVSVAAK